MDECEICALLHWNAEKQREENWLFLEFPSCVYVEHAQLVMEIASSVLGRRPLVALAAETYLRGNKMVRPRDWLAGPITEEEAAAL